MAVLRPGSNISVYAPPATPPGWRCSRLIVLIDRVGHVRLAAPLAPRPLDGGYVCGLSDKSLHDLGSQASGVWLL